MARALAITIRRWPQVETVESEETQYAEISYAAPRRAVFIAVTLAAVPALPVRAADTEVNIENFTFAPKELTVKAGTVIVFRNRDDIPHTVNGTNAEFIPRRSIRTRASPSPLRIPEPMNILRPASQMTGRVVVTP